MTVRAVVWADDTAPPFAPVDGLAHVLAVPADTVRTLDGLWRAGEAWARRFLLCAVLDDDARAGWMIAEVMPRTGAILVPAGLLEDGARWRGWIASAWGQAARRPLVLVDGPVMAGRHGRDWGAPYFADRDWVIGR